MGAVQPAPTQARNAATVASVRSRQKGVVSVKRTGLPPSKQAASLPVCVPALPRTKEPAGMSVMSAGQYVSEGASTQTPVSQTWAKAPPQSAWLAQRFFLGGQA